MSGVITNRESLPAIPAEHRGPDFSHPKELRIGQRVLNLFYGQPRIVTVRRRHPVSVTVAWVDPQGNERVYAESLRNLWRLA